MFGAYYPGQSYPAEGPAATIEFVALNICHTDSYSLMSPRDAVTLMPTRESMTLMPERDSAPFCETEEES